MQHIAGLIDRRPGAACAVAAAVGLVAGQFAAERAGGQAPVVVAHAVRHTEPARDAVGIGDRGLGHEVIVLGAGQLFQAVGLLELAKLQVVVGVAAELVLDVVVQEASGAADGGASHSDFLQHAGVVAGDPFKVARPLALEYQLGAANAEFGIVAVGADRSVEILHVVVEPVAIGLDQAFQRHFRAADHIDGDFGVGCRRGERHQQCGAKQGRRKFHGALRPDEKVGAG